MRKVSFDIRTLNYPRLGSEWKIGKLTQNGWTNWMDLSTRTMTRNYSSNGSKQLVVTRPTQLLPILLLDTPSLLLLGT